LKIRCQAIHTRQIFALLILPPGSKKESRHLSRTNRLGGTCVIAVEGEQSPSRMTLGSNVCTMTLRESTRHCTTASETNVVMKQTEATTNFRRRKKSARRLGAFGALTLSGVLMMALFLRGGLLTEDHQSHRLLKDTKHSHFQQALSDEDFSEYSCDNLYQHAMNQTSRCAYAQTCNDGDGIFAPIVYCSEKYSMRFLSLCLGPPLIVFLIILFRILGSTAEE
jgi:hypothetical protein